MPASHHQAAGDRVKRQCNPTLIDDENIHLGSVQFGILNTLCLLHTDRFLHWVYEG